MGASDDGGDCQDEEENWNEKGQGRQENISKTAPCRAVALCFRDRVAN